MPEPGDILFINSPGADAIASAYIKKIASGYIQRKIDPDAALASRAFRHVAVVVSNTLALEAVPAPDPKDVGRQSFKLPDTVEIAEWSSVELRGGVRFIPIADLVIPAMRPEAELLALRSPDTYSAARSTLTPFHPAILRLLGSRYSIDTLKAKAETAFPKTLAEVIGSKVDWTSIPTDFATRIDVDAALRKRIEAMLPDYALPDAARTYYCSQLAVACLTVAGLLAADAATEMTMPTGLYHLLLARDWTDVSAHYRCAPDAKRYLNMSPLTYEASYLAALAMTRLELETDAWRLQLDYIGSSLKAMERICDRVIGALDRSELRTPTAPGKSRSTDDPAKSN